MRLDGQQAISDTLATIGETSGRVGKAEGDVTLATIYCRLPELGPWFGERGPPPPRPRRRPF